MVPFLIITHTLSDFIFQSDELISLKKEMRIKPFLIHAGMFAGISMIPALFIHGESRTTYILLLLLTAMIHGITDYLKEGVKRLSSNGKWQEEWNVVLFVVDQLIHILIIVMLFGERSFSVNIQYQKSIEGLMGEKEAVAHILKRVAVILYSALSGAFLIPLMLNVVYKGIPNYAGYINGLFQMDIHNNKMEQFIKVKTGKWIGILERTFITFFLFLGEYSAIGYIIGVKSLARFKQMDEKIFAEYYLLGTMFSVLYTFLVFEFMKYV